MNRKPGINEETTMNRKPGIMVGRESFMQNIASRLGRDKPLTIAPAHPNRGVPAHYDAIHLTSDENIEVFCENWTKLSGKVLIVKQAEAKQAIAAYLQEVIAELEVTRVTAWEHDELNSLGLTETLTEAGIEVVLWREGDEGEIGESGEAIEASVDSNSAAIPFNVQTNPQSVAVPNNSSKWSRRSKLLRDAESCQMGIVWPDYAIANTSTLALLARGGKGRSVSLLPSILFAIFREDQLVTRMGEVYTKIREMYPNPIDLPSSINLITGPSRSADIENDLTIGIHGPGKVYSVIIIP